MTDSKRPPGRSIFPAQALDAVSNLRQSLGGNAASTGAAGGAQTPPGAEAKSAPAAIAKPPATETIARRAGAIIDEVDFPGFVAGLVHGTFDAIVDASIRQMESYSSLVSAVAKTVDQFTEENVTPNQARDYLAQRYPADVRLVLPTAETPEPRIEPRAEGATPGWLADYGLAGQELTAELLEESVLPLVRRNLGTERQQLLATMVMLGMNRVAVRDGSITAKVMFRAAAQDSAKVGVAVNSDPQGLSNWGERGSSQYASATTMVSTVAVNAQSDSSIRADLFGEVKLNFVSETLPLDRLADAAKIALVQRNSPVAGAANPPATAPAAPTPPGGNGEGG